MSKPIACPCCGKELFRLVAMQSDPFVLGMNTDGPPIESDANGFFMECPHCSKRVIFEVAPAPTGKGFLVAGTQPCADWP